MDRPRPAYLNNIPLPINPTSIQWEFSLKTATHKTIGGKVVQVYGVRLGDLVVGGKMPMSKYWGDWNVETGVFVPQFYFQVDAIVRGQVPTAQNPRPDPVRFYWPDRGWDFQVYVKKLTGPGGVGVYHENKNIAPEWQMTLFVAEDNADILQVARDSAQAAYIRRITAGLGWQQSEWNGPLAPTQGLADAIEKGQSDPAQGVLQYLTLRYTDIQTPTGNLPDGVPETEPDQ